jgi:glutamine synthetase
MRGKRVPVDQLDKITSGALRMPLSLLSMDIWGEDIEDNELVFRHRRCRWPVRFHRPAAQPGGMDLAPGGIRPALDAAGRRPPLHGRSAPGPGRGGRPLQGLGLTPVVATELEFYIVDPSGAVPQPPCSPVTGKRLDSDGALSLDELQHFDAFLNEVYDACAAHGIPADAAISENGAGQFEINLLHVADPLEAADDAVLFKRLVRGIARKHGFAATFMAKPYGDRAGSGMHVHFSLNDAEGRNVFDNGGEEGTEILRHAVAGLIRTMQENALVFAPHENSFRRLLPGAHAPSSVAWGYENRTVAVRIPGGSPKARRIEHRVAGADANPYLVLASILGGALLGIEGKWEPPAPVTGDAYSQNLETLPPDWASAIEAFSRGPHVTQIYARRLQRMFVQCKLQELRRFTRHVTEFEYHSYLEAV